MDKQTLSNYGWVVIAVLVLSVMIALATPFGQYVRNAVTSTTEGLFDVQQNALGAAGMIIRDQSFDNADNASAPKEYTEWKTKSWGELTNFRNRMWTDGNNIYYSNGRTQYVLKGNVWETKNWNNTPEFFFKSDIWTDGANIYCSFYNGDTCEDEHYVLSNGNWVEKVWNNAPECFQADFIWSDGKNTYYSNADTDDIQLVLDGDTWKQMNWSGYNDVSGGDIWTDGTNIYCSNDYYRIQYILKGTTWEKINWNGFAPKYGYYIWTDGTNTYYSYGSDQYVLNGNTWEAKVWNGLTSFDGYDVWTDGTNIYYSHDTHQYVLS